MPRPLLSPPLAQTSLRKNLNYHMTLNVYHSLYLRKLWFEDIKKEFSSIAQKS